MPSSNSQAASILAAINLNTNDRITKARERGLGAYAIAIANREAEEAKTRLRGLVISFENALPATIATARRPDSVGQLIRLRCTLTTMADPILITLPREEADLIQLLGETVVEESLPELRSLASELTLSDQGDQLTTHVFVDRQLIESIQDQQNSVANWEFLLYVTAETPFAPHKDKGTAAGAANGATFAFHVVDARPLMTALQMVAPTPGEVDEALKRYGQEANLLQVGQELVADYLEIQDLDDLPILREGIQFQVLAAATEGLRAHTLIIGPPAVGKSYVPKTAELLQPIFYEAMPTKVTEAGLIGSGASKRANRSPGLLPRAHTGAFSIQDFNQANSVKNQRLCATLTHVMAECKVMDASVSGCTYMTSVSILIDANRRSDVRATNSTSTGLRLVVEDIGIPTNILSRMTYIAEIDKDPRRQIQVAKSIILAKGTLAADKKKELAERIRLLQVYLAHVRSAFVKVTIDEALRKVLVDQVTAACNTTEARFAQHPELSDFLARLAGQAVMLVEAHARLHGRGVAILADVEAIFPFLWRKLDWLKGMLYGGQADETQTTANAPARRRLIELCLRTWGRPTCTPQQVRRHLGLESASLTTITEDLRAILGEPGPGFQFQVVCLEAAHV